MNLLDDENPNVAMKAVFDFGVKEKSFDRGLIIQNSSNNGDIIKIPRFSINTSNLKLDSVNVENYEAAQNTIRCCDYVLNYVSSKRSLYGAYQNRLKYTYNNSRNVLENTQAAESRIRDTDMADEMVSYSNNQVLLQAGQSILAQANQANQGVLSLLQ